MHSGCKTRIPGPAGDIVTDLISVAQTRGRSKTSSEYSDDDHISTSDSFDEVFSQSVAWKSMTSAFESDPPPAKLLSHLCKSGSKKKIPRLAVSIVCLECIYDAYATFRDDSGLMQGTIHRKVFEEYQGLVEIGAVLVLKNVSVFSPTLTDHFLNVCPANIEQIFPYSTRQDTETVNLVSVEGTDERTRNLTPKARPSCSQDRDSLDRSIRQKLHHGDLIGANKEISQEKFHSFSPENTSLRSSSESLNFLQSGRKGGIIDCMSQAIETRKFPAVASFPPESSALSCNDKRSAPVSCKSSVWTNTSVLSEQENSVEFLQSLSPSSQLPQQHPSVTLSTSVSFSQTVELPDINMDLLEESALEL